MLTVDFDLLGVRPGHTILDAGCGAGRHSFEAYRRGAEVVAMDYDLEECEKVLYSFVGSRDEDRAGGGTWQMVRSDVLCLPFAEESFDRIICAEVMEHLHEDSRALRGLAKALKRGGRIAITVPTAFTEAAYGWIEPFYFENPGGHVRIFTPWELAKKIRAAGLDIYAIRHAHGFHSLYWLLRCIFGLEDEDHPVSGAYRRFLDMVIRSAFMLKLERRIFDRVCAKSIIFYAWKQKE